MSRFIKKSTSNFVHLKKSTSNFVHLEKFTSNFVYYLKKIRSLFSSIQKVKPTALIFQPGFGSVVSFCRPIGNPLRQNARDRKWSSSAASFQFRQSSKEVNDLFTDELELADKDILEEAIEDEAEDKEEVDAEIWPRNVIFNI